MHIIQGSDKPTCLVQLQDGGSNLWCIKSDNNLCSDKQQHSSPCEQRCQGSQHTHLQCVIPAVCKQPSLLAPLLPPLTQHPPP